MRFLEFLKKECILTLEDIEGIQTLPAFKQREVEGQTLDVQDITLKWEPEQVEFFSLAKPKRRVIELQQMVK